MIDSDYCQQFRYKTTETFADTMSLLDIFKKPKDVALSSLINLLLPYLQNRFKPYGTMTNLHIDSTAKSISLSLDLKGEHAPIDVQLRNYQIVEQDGQTLIRFGEIETSREWITQLIRDSLPEERKTIPLPPSIARIAKLLL